MKVISIHVNSAVATQPEVLNPAISIDLPKQKNVFLDVLDSWFFDNQSKKNDALKQEQRAFTN